MNISKIRINVFLPSILITVVLLIQTYGCTQPEGVLYIENQYWSPDSSASFKYKEYGIGITGVYQTIEVNGQEVLRFDRGSVYGGWINNETIKIVSNNPPKSSNLEGTCLKIIVVQAESFSDFLNLMNLGNR